MNNTFKCIIVDDEPNAIEFLTDSIRELYDNIEITATFTSWKKALTALREHNFDILFMDISLPQMNGMSVLEMVPGLRCEVIFVTAYSQYALNAFNFPVSGYVLKPVKEKDLSKAVDRAIDHITNRRLAEQKTTGNTPHRNHKIGIPNNRGLDYVDVNDILYLEAIKRYTKVVVKNGHDLLSSYGIGRFGSMVGSSFFHIHRSFIVNVNYIVRYKTIGSIVMCNGIEIPVSKHTKDDFLKVFENVEGYREG